MARFVVDLGDVTLTAEQRAAVSNSIHAAVLPHLARLPGPGGGQLIGVIGHWGVGIIKSSDKLPELVEALKRDAET